MVGVIDGFRWAILGEPARLDLLALLLSFAVSAIALVSGALYFRHVERTLADIL
jgi:lipopolysaccharide transport system permease protein